MPVTIPPADLHATNSRSTHYQGHQRLRDEEDVVGLAPHLTNTGVVGDKLEAGVDVSKYSTAEGQDDDDYSAKVDSEGQVYPTATGIKGRAQRLMQILVKHGVEARATEPVPEEVSRAHPAIPCESHQPLYLQERAELKWWSLVPQFTLWAAANTNILSFSAGVLGPNLFGLDFKSSVWVIIVFNVLSAVPVAYFATFGPLLGMRQMVQTRYSFGYVKYRSTFDVRLNYPLPLLTSFYPALLPALCNCLTMLGFLAVNAILGGQTLSLASGSGMSYDVGIVVVGIISLMVSRLVAMRAFAVDNERLLQLSFLGLKALHYYSMSLFPIIIVLYFVLVGVTGNKLHLAKEVSRTIEVSAGQILG